MNIFSYVKLQPKFSWKWVSLYSYILSGDNIATILRILTKNWATEFNKKVYVKSWFYERSREMMNYNLILFYICSVSKHSIHTLRSCHLMPVFWQTLASSSPKSCSPFLKSFQCTQTEYIGVVFQMFQQYCTDAQKHSISKHHSINTPLSQYFLPMWWELIFLDIKGPFQHIWNIRTMVKHDTNMDVHNFCQGLHYSWNYWILNVYIYNCGARVSIPKILLINTLNYFVISVSW